MSGKLGVEKMLSLREVISYSDDWENKMNIFLNEGVDFMNS